VALAGTIFLVTRLSSEPTPELAPSLGAAESSGEEAVDKPRRRGVIVNYELFASKDPFDPLVGQEAAGSVGDDAIRRISVVSAGNRFAEIGVDGAIHRVSAGEIFAENFQLLSSSEGCATVLFGDDEFTLCEGEEVVK
jgi:hypothetical protein